MINFIQHKKYSWIKRDWFMPDYLKYTCYVVVIETVEGKHLCISIKIIFNEAI